MSEQGTINRPDYLQRAGALTPIALQLVPVEVLSALQAAKRLWIVPHERPDADALGAALGLQQILERRGVEAVVVSSDVPPAVYQVIPNISDVSLAAPEWIPDTIVLVDCADPSRTGRIGVAIESLPDSTQRILIDHHVSNTSTWPLAWIDAHAAATCELVSLIALAMSADFTANNGRLATTLAAGIIMDTATFQHGNTTSRTLEVGALLLAAGAPISEISRKIYRSKPRAQVELHARVLAQIKTSDAGRTIYTTMSLSDLQETGATPEMSEGIVDALAQVTESNVAIFLKEDDPNTTRISVRTKGDGPEATAVTKAFGGGGHARASGATVERPLPDALAEVLAHVSTLRSRAKEG
ncbi:MAG: bifunctional oligoribonuclease/PAP phosphatase NrnA [bacterium]|jgi:phosphoesterase RecJ-like protein|nr:bifunctional oligoribonuclease/PAP phosphatase NrnA [Candidatus Aquidulcis sp.]